MAGSAYDARDAGRRCLRQDDLRPDQHQAANNSQRRFHKFKIIPFAKDRQTDFGELLSILGVLVGSAD